MWCRLFGHKWNFSKESIKHITNIGTKSVSINVDTDFVQDVLLSNKDFIILDTKLIG